MANISQAIPSNVVPNPFQLHHALTTANRIHDCRGCTSQPFHCAPSGNILFTFWRLMQAPANGTCS